MECSAANIGHLYTVCECVCVYVLYRYAYTREGSFYVKEILSVFKGLPYLCCLLASSVRHDHSIPVCELVNFASASALKCVQQFHFRGNNVRETAKKGKEG